MLTVDMLDPHVSPIVRKRDGNTLQDFDVQKIKNAIRKAWLEAEGTADETKIELVTGLVQKTLVGVQVDVERIQDAVEVALMKYDLYAVAKAYIIYRNKRSAVRSAQQDPDPTAISSYIHFAKYAKYQPEWLRRESYLETVDRVELMHLNRFASLPEADRAEIKWAFDQVREQRVLPSMRSMQFGGRAIEVNNNRVYNCTSSFIDRLGVFSEALFLLLSGCGVGYSVQFDHVEKLPTLVRIDPKNVVHHVIADSIEGWANALSALVHSYTTGEYVEFSYHLIRPAGTLLKTSGGRAPGHRKLKEAIEQIRRVLNGAQGRKLRPIECHDMMCHTADAVLSGGIRRSAMISLFSLEDSEMMNAKTGNWYETHPWRENSNNSVFLKRDEVTKKAFLRIFKMTREWGEPGFFFCTDNDYSTNPCCEIGLNPKLTIDAKVMALLEARTLRGKPMPDVKLGDVFSGWAFCNLCEINGAKLKTFEDFQRAARAASIIGTMQSTYTDMPYLGWVSEVIAERESLLGIGMTGMMDSPEVTLNPEMQRAIAIEIRGHNERWAEKLGVLPAARTTCVKPSGTTSLELGCVGSGHHAHHAKRYIRRVTADEYEVVFQAFKALNPQACVRKPNGKWVVEFPVQPPKGAALKEDFTAIQFLEAVKSTQLNWVLPGTARPDASPGLNHNVSNTVTVGPEEWEAVAEYIWANREFFTGVSLLAKSGDKDYAFAPMEAIVTEADEARWSQLVASYKPVDYTLVLEAEDGTTFTAEAACASGACSFAS